MPTLMEIPSLCVQGVSSISCVIILSLVAPDVTYICKFSTPRVPGPTKRHHPFAGVALTLPLQVVFSLLIWSTVFIANLVNVPLYDQRLHPNTGGRPSPQQYSR